jgi:AbiV family abortive infection protein
VKKKLDAYKGRLDAAQIAEGMNAACKNSNRLLADAAFLFEARRYPSAIGTAILAIEEAGKISILRRLAIALNDRECVEAWKEYRSHTSKNAMWAFPSLLASGARSLEDFRPLFSQDAEHPYLLDQLKQIAFYTDCLGKANWSVPDEVIDESIARSIIDTAKLLVDSPNHTEKELVLWIKHMAPAFASKDLDLMKRALVNWHCAMQTSDLDPIKVSDFEYFIDDGMCRS